MTLQEGIDAGIIFVILAIPLTEVGFCEVHGMRSKLLSADGTNYSDLDWNWIITENYTLSYLSFR